MHRYTWHRWLHTDSDVEFPFTNYSWPPFFLQSKRLGDLNVFLQTDSSKTPPGRTPKKVKLEVYKLTQEQKSLIKNDKQNKKVWDEAMESLSLGPVSSAVYLVTSPAGFLNAAISIHIHDEPSRMFDSSKKLRRLFVLYFVSKRQKALSVVAKNTLS